MKICPFCAEEIKDEAVKCRHCGEFLDGRLPGCRPGYGYEFRSRRMILGFPLVHIARGIDSRTGRVLVAKGWIAIGNIAVGLFAMGGIALGGFVFGGLGFGIFAMAGLAAGGIALGGVAIGLVFAGGGLAVSLFCAVGGLALAPHALGGNGADPEMLEFFRRLKGWWIRR